MKIVLVSTAVTLPVARYGGTERVMWWLGKELARRGHEVTYLIRGGSCAFARVQPHDPARPLAAQIPPGTDVVHLHHNLPAGQEVPHPYVVTLHGAGSRDVDLDRNTVFISRSQAERFGSSSFVYNGIDWEEYGAPDLERPRTYVHFLGDAGWKVKNVRGAIRVAGLAGERLFVLGGFRLNFRMGFRLTLSPRVRFFGWVDAGEKQKLLPGSKAMIFPVRWHEPFGLAIVESLYYGCPVFGTPYGSLPEIVLPDVGLLSASAAELSEGVRGAARFDRRRCHEYAVSRFGSRAMADGYLEVYQRVAAGEMLHAARPRRQTPPSKALLPFD
jgi:glycosyltransferase involved in cell wall biosynthesis